MLIWGDEVDFIKKDKTFSDNMHDRVCFSTTTLARNEHAKIFIQEIAKASPLCGKFRVIVWNLHFNCQNDFFFPINVVLTLKMDLERIKRFANSEFESWKIAKAVTEVKNEVKNVEQGRDVVISDVFKTLREPLIEQQKKNRCKTRCCH